MELTEIDIPKNVIRIGEKAFYVCTKLKTVVFSGNAPTIGSNAFGSNTTTVYYPSYNSTWISNVLQNYGGTIKWVPYTGAAPASTLKMGSNSISAMSTYPGDYNTEIKDNVQVKTASFEGLVAGEEYALLVLVDMGAENTLSPENLLYIEQGTALEDGTLSFEYVQRTDTDISYVLACGPSSKNLSDAVITFPEMEADGEVRAVEPTVVYDGKTLTEGVDYIIVGTVDYTTGGTYTCYIRGIYDYAGLVTCTYTVEGDYILGDANGDGAVKAADSLMAKRIAAGIDTPTALQEKALDVNGDEKINSADTNLISRFIAGIILEF